MKTIIFLILLSFVSLVGSSQTNEVQKLSTLCKVWGFLKYYHPAVTGGKIDWDQVLIDKMTLIKAAKNKEEVNKVYSDWLTSLGKVKKRDQSINNVPDSLKFNLDLKWMYDTTAFTADVITKLNYIRENRSKKQGYYIRFRQMPSPDFDKENKYCDMKFPAEEYRLIGLFRYWNIVQFFFPYKHLIGEDWNGVLDEMIPKFRNCSDTLAYSLAMAELVTRTNDSHGSFYSKYTIKYHGLKLPPFKISIINNKAVVSGFYNDSLKEACGMQLGDIILKKDGRDISEIIAEKEKYFGASNYPTKLRNIKSYLLRSDKDSIEISFERDGEIYTKTIKQLNFKYFNHKPVALVKPVVCKILPNDIGYVNMGYLTIKQVDSVMKIMMDKKAIIFDIRNYPKGTMYAVAMYLNKEKKAFVKFTRPDFTYPGVFYWDKPYYCGRENKDYFKGKVVLLFNEETQSHAEFTCMALQTAPDVKCIGSQTAGADGNVTTISFPGEYNVWMTGLGIYYPDGRETQRIGIVPDIEVKPTIEGIKAGKDEVLERAIEYIEMGR